MKIKVFLFGSVISILILTLNFSGCTEVGIGVTNIGDITVNPLDYLGREATVKGTCVGANITDDKGHTLMYEYNNLLSGDYQLTGIIWTNHLGYIYIDVTKVKSI
jgi:hypothetical protein